MPFVEFESLADEIMLFYVVYVVFETLLRGQKVYNYQNFYFEKDGLIG